MRAGPTYASHFSVVSQTLGRPVRALLVGSQSNASLVGAVLDHYGKIDILVNNAGTVWGASAIEHSPEAWRNARRRSPVLRGCCPRWAGPANHAR
jgi:hypothetical protein